MDLGRSRVVHQGGKMRFRPMAEINVTPFVDVMLVLLIIFMVAAPLLSVGVVVDLPDTAAGPLSAPDDNEEPLSVSIDENERIFILDNEIERARLVSTLQAIAGERTGRTVYVRADGSVPYLRVMEVLGALDAGGFDNVSLVTDGGGPALDGQESDSQGNGS